MICIHRYLLQDSNSFEVAFPLSLKFLLNVILAQAWNHHYIATDGSALIVFFFCQSFSWFSCEWTFYFDLPEILKTRNAMSFYTIKWTKFLSSLELVSVVWLFLVLWYVLYFPKICLNWVSLHNQLWAFVKSLQSIHFSFIHLSRYSRETYFRSKTASYKLDKNIQISKLDSNYVGEMYLWTPRRPRWQFKSVGG